MGVAVPTSLSPGYLKRLELLRIEARRSYLGFKQGSHLSPRRGHGIEFADYRQYELGDNPRHIDWGVFARSERLYVKRFREEQDLAVLILLDASASMATPRQDGKWDRAVELALSLAYIALMQQDTVVVSVPGVWLSPRLSGGRAFQHINQELRQISPGAIGPLIPALPQTLATVTYPGVAVFISDLLFERQDFDQILRMLQAKNLEVTTLRVEGLHDQNPLTESTALEVIDSETGERFDMSYGPAEQRRYADAWMAHTDFLRNHCGARRVGYSVVPARAPLEESAIAAFSETGLVGL